MSRVVVQNVLRGKCRRRSNRSWVCSRYLRAAPDVHGGWYHGTELNDSGSFFLAQPSSKVENYRGIIKCDTNVVTLLLYENWSRIIKYDIIFMVSWLVTENAGQEHAGTGRRVREVFAALIAMRQACVVAGIMNIACMPPCYPWRYSLSQRSAIGRELHSTL